MSAFLLAKPLMSDTMYWNLQQYMCIFAIVKYKSDIGGMSKMISVLLKFIFVSVSIKIQALTLVQKGTTFIKRGGNMFPIVSYTGHHILLFFIHHLALMPIILCVETIMSSK